MSLFLPFFSENPEAILDSNGGDGVYKCDPCNFETKYSGNLKEHFKTQKHLSNTNSSTHEDIPNFELINNESTPKIRKSNGDGTYKCDPCNFETKYSGNLTEHFRTQKHLKNTEFESQEVLDFENGGQINEPKVNIRKELIDGEIHRCEPCNFESKWIQSLQAHYKSSKHISNTDPSNEKINYEKSNDSKYLDEVLDFEDNSIGHEQNPNGNWDHSDITSACVWLFLVQPNHFSSRSEQLSDFLKTHPPKYFFLQMNK